ncbi:unnamed protein product [Haemonchus placei]|uniref:Uncharacterized protein n=1 Tax=Haemonchus placei TaxID=6290 RepID=A0A3P8AUF5_HAEPC|nr:unnamed protein product [Haemonchus placei]
MTGFHETAQRFFEQTVETVRFLFSIHVFLHLFLFLNDKFSVTVYYSTK